MDPGSSSSISRSDEGDDEMQVVQKNLMDSDNDDGGDGAEFLDAAREGLGPDELLRFLEKNPVLHMAARDGDIQTIAKLIAFMEEKQDLQLKEGLMDTNVNGDTALHEALNNGHREVAHKLFKANRLAAYTRNNDEISPHELAKKAGYDQMSVLEGTLFSGLADVEMEAVRKGLLDVSLRSVTLAWVKLSRAIRDDDQENVLIEGLMNHGKQLLNHQYHFGKTLLHVAVAAPRIGPLEKLVEFMVGNGLTDVIYQGDRCGDTALHLAVERGKFDKALCLIKAGPEVVYQVNDFGVSPLYMAVYHGQKDLVKHMVSQGALADCETEILQHPKHTTLAHIAIKARFSGILQTLMEHLPKLIKVTDEKGWRPLSYAAYKGCFDEVNYLLTSFPKSVEKYDKDGSLPIHKAVGGGHVSILQAFLTHCPKALHHVDRKGRSVLHIAVRYARADILSCLTKECNIDDSFLNIRDNEAKTFMDYITELKH